MVALKLIDVAVPDLGEFADVSVVELLATVGDVVARDDSLVVIESDKATMELPAPTAGTLRELLVKVGDRVSEGSLIARIEPSAEDSGVAPGCTAPECAAPGGAVQAGAGSSNGPAATGPAPYAGPVVRRMARDHGIALESIAGSGTRGRITRGDLRRALESIDAPTLSGEAAGTSGPPAGPTPGAGPADTRYGEVTRTPLSRIERASAGSLARNWAQIPHVTHNEKADITALEAWRKELNREQADVKVTILALALKALATALGAFPRLNASLDGDDLLLKRYIHIGVATDTEHGLVVPVIRDVDRLGVFELARQVAALSAKARAGRLSPAELSGGSFTVSSLGGLGGTAFTPIVNAPEVAILGLVRAATEPVWNGDRFQPRLVLPMSLSYDHRAVDGALAARFCTHLAHLLGDFRRVLV